MRDKLHAIDQGSGPPLLLVHGFPLDHTMWRHQMEAFASECRVIAPTCVDLAIRPLSRLPPRPAYRWPTTPTIWRPCWRNSKCISRSRCAQFSMGGYIAWQFYHRHRAKLRRIVLCDTKAAADTPKVRETRYKMAESVEGWGAAHVATLMVTKLFDPATLSDDAKLVDEVRHVIGRTNPVAIAAAQRGMAHREDQIAALAAIDVPVLYVVGKADQISPPDEMKAMADATPGAEYVEVPTRGISVPWRIRASLTGRSRSSCGGSHRPFVSRVAASQVGWPSGRKTRGRRAEPVRPIVANS